MWWPGSQRSCRGSSSVSCNALADLSEREEVLQETFLRLAGYDAVADLDNPRAFLFRVAETWCATDRAAHARDGEICMSLSMAII